MVFLGFGPQMGSNSESLIKCKLIRHMSMWSLDSRKTDVSEGPTWRRKGRPPRPESSPRAPKARVSINRHRQNKTKKKWKNFFLTKNYRRNSKKFHEAVVNPKGEECTCDACAVKTHYLQTNPFNHYIPPPAPPPTMLASAALFWLFLFYSAPNFPPSSTS